MQHERQQGLDASSYLTPGSVFFFFFRGGGGGGGGGEKQTGKIGNFSVL